MIYTNVSNFKAYHTEGNDPTVSVENLEPLTIEKEDDTLKIFSASKDETKKVLYSYEINGSVEKYMDVADLTYAFFDESNETDLHQVKISIHTPAKAVTENTHFFLHDDETGSLSATDESIIYTNSLLEAGEDSTIRLIFPSEQLSSMELDDDKVMGKEILDAEKEQAERLANLDTNMEKVTPVIWLLIGALIIITAFILITHPNRYRGDKSEDGLLRILESTDPLFVKYMNDHDVDFQGYLLDNSFIAGLFSLKQRGVVTLEEAHPSEMKKKQHFDSPG